MSLRPEEMELHRQLLAAFDHYIKLNLRWEEKGYRVDGRKTRKAIRKLMDVAYLRWQELLVRMHEMEVENGTKKAEKIILKSAGDGFMKGMHVAKMREKNKKVILPSIDDKST